MFVIPPSLDHSISAAAYSFALLKGGTPERILAGLVGTIWLWTHYLHPVSAAPGSMHEVGVHAAIAFVTCIVAVRYDSWPLLVASMASVLSVATDAAELLNPLHRWAYFTALFTRNYIYLAALAAGAWTSWRRRRAGAQLTAA